MELLYFVLFADTLLTTLAGNGNLSPGFVDGIGTNALFAGPYWVAVDSNRNIYVTDQSNKAIRKMTTAGLCLWVDDHITKVIICFFGLSPQRK